MKDLKRLVFVDLEMSGIAPDAGILSIGAVHYNTGREFYIEAKLDYGQDANLKSLQVNGFTVEQCHDDSKPTQLEAVKKFYKWVESLRKDFFNKDLAIMGGHNIMGDVKALKRVKESWPFQSRLVDVHGVAFAFFGESLSAKALCEELCVEPEPVIHNALEGAKQGMRCFDAMTCKNLRGNRC